MALIDIITNKKLGRALTTGELRDLANAARDPATPDYQLAALLMAIRLNGMDERETAELTLAMAQTGDMLKPDVGGVAVDKHSTGGVGDTTTLILGPLVAACGGKVLKMSGRGLGHTGGTIDKLESIPGFQTELPEEDFLRITRQVGCCVVGQTGELAPADKRLYALRDVTSTVDSVPLIASSIMSKKLAGGAEGIVLDVKCGSGALMKTLADSLGLARAMVDIGQRNGRRMSALITRMDEPLGIDFLHVLEPAQHVPATLQDHRLDPGLQQGQGREVSARSGPDHNHPLPPKRPGPEARPHRILPPHGHAEQESGHLGPGVYGPPGHAHPELPVVPQTGPGQGQRPDHLGVAHVVRIYDQINNLHDNPRIIRICVMAPHAGGPLQDPGRPAHKPLPPGTCLPGSSSGTPSPDSYPLQHGQGPGSPSGGPPHFPGIFRCSRTFWCACRDFSVSRLGISSRST